MRNLPRLVCVCVDVDVFSVYFMQPNEKETFDVHELNVSAIFMYLPLAFAAEYVNVILSLVFHLVCSCAILSVPLQPPVYQMKKKQQQQQLLIQKRAGLTNATISM